MDKLCGVASDSLGVIFIRVGEYLSSIVHVKYMFILNILFLFFSCIHTFISWTYRGGPFTQLLLQSLCKIIFAFVLCRIKTGQMPIVQLYNKYLIISALMYSLSSLCTSYLWNTDMMTPYVYSMGTKPSLFFTNAVQNGCTKNMIATLSLVSFLSVDRELVPIFILKCVLSATSSYFSYWIGLL